MIIILMALIGTGTLTLIMVALPVYIRIVPMLSGLHVVDESDKGTHADTNNIDIDGDNDTACD